MRNSTRLTLAFTATAALLGALALPASAADTPLTATVPTGTLTITAPTASVGLGSVSPGTTGTATAPGECDRNR